MHTIISHTPQPATQALTRQQAKQQWAEPHKQLTQQLKSELLTHGSGTTSNSSLTETGWHGKGQNCTLRVHVLQRSHDTKLAGHFGFLKTLHLVKRQFWWPKMRKDIKSYVKSCAICSAMKTRPGKPPGLLQTIANPTRPWGEIAMDFIIELPTSSGNTIFWTVVDLFSKQAHFILCSGSPSAQKLAKLFLKHIYRLHRVPKRIISDQGVQFTTKFWREFLRLIGSSQGLSLAFHLSTNSAAE